MGGERIMKKVVAMIRTERVVALKEHLSKIGITVITIADITAWAIPTKIALQRREIPLSYDLIHRAKVEIFISEDLLNQVVKAIFSLDSWNVFLPNMIGILY
jgi:nitrogen regulatory protein PII